MNFITPAYAQAIGAGGPTDFVMQLVPFAVILVIMYFMIMRPQQQRAKAHQDMITSVRRGDTVVTAGGMKAGEAVLIQGASSGVGLMGMQIAKAMGAKLVLGSSTNAERRAKLKEFGCDVAIDTTNPAWPQQVLDATGGKGVELIVDQVSGGVANGNLACCAILGRIVNVGRLGGFKGEFDFDLHAMRRISYIGVTFRTRSVEEVREIVRVMKADLWGKIEAGALRLPIDRTFPLEEAAAALAHMKANQHFGKIVLEC